MLGFLEPFLNDLHSLLDHFTESQTLVCELCPSSVKNNLKDRSDQSPSWLSDVNHIGNQGESIQFKLWDIGLEQNIDLGTRFLNALLYWNRNSFHQFL